MDSEIEEHLKEIYRYIKNYHLLCGATDYQASFLANLNVYYLKPFHHFKRNPVIRQMSRELDNLIESFVDKKKLTNFELLEVLFKKLEDIINSEERVDDIDIIPKLSVFVQNGKLTGRIDQIYRRKF